MTYGRKVASSPTEIAHAKLYVSFGDNLSVTRISGGSMSWQFLQAIEKNHVKTIVIDLICTDTVAGKVDPDPPRDRRRALRSARLRIHHPQLGGSGVPR